MLGQDYAYLCMSFKFCSINLQQQWNFLAAVHLSQQLPFEQRIPFYYQHAFGALPNYEVSHARLLATMTKESGAGLQALPITSLGLRTDDTTLRIAVEFRLGTAICAAHLRHHCGAEVDSLGTHGLSCRHSEGQFHRHSRHHQLGPYSAKIPLPWCLGNVASCLP